MEAKSVKLALFDFDGTIAEGDSIVSFLCYAVLTGKTPFSVLLQGMRGYLKQKRRGTSTIFYKEQALSFLTDMTAEERHAFCRAYIEKELKPRFFPEALRELQACRAEGYHILLVSASVSLYMEELKAFLPVDAVLSTRAVLDKQEKYTGKLQENCKGPEKIKRVEEYLRERGWNLDRENSRAYGDSRSDRYMLSMVDHPVLVNPKRALREAYPDAEIRRWTRRSST